MSDITLTLPPIGFGTYALRGRSGADAVTSAIRNGYRLIDSAFSYENEASVADGVARAVDEGAAAREDLIVTSKIPGRHFGYEPALAAIEESAARMRVIGPIDLYLIHWPNPLQDKYVDTWRALIEARERGLVRAIGVSNFLPGHIERLEAATGVLPAVNQIESHPRFPNTGLIAYDAERGIATEAWSPLGRDSNLLAEAVIVDVAAAHAITAAQAVLAWHVARGVTPIPKSANSHRQVENLASQAVLLSPAEVGAIASLGRPDGRLAGFLRAADADGLGVVDLDGESVRIDAERVLIPHPAIIPDLDDLREFAAELSLSQRFDQLFREVHRPDPANAERTQLTDWSGGAFDQLRFATGRAASSGFKVSGGYAVCPVYEDGALITARYWIGADAPDYETETGDLHWIRSGDPVPIGQVGPVAYSEGVRMATRIYAGRKPDKTEGA